MSTHTFTIKELMGKNPELDKKTAYALMTALVGLKLAEPVGTRKTEGKKGAGEAVYRVDAAVVRAWFNDAWLP